VLRATVVGAQHTHATDQHRHLGSCQPHQLSAIQQQFLRLDDIVLLLPVAETIRWR
jgi:hypothetical protein